MTHKDIIRTIRGSSPVYTNEAFDFLKAKGLGHYVGGHVDEWRWESEDCECWNLPTCELTRIYLTYCKQ